MKWIDDLFYFLYKDYGTTIQYTKILKAEIDYDTGARNDDKKSYSIPAVLTPKNLYHQFLAKNLGRTEYNKTMFLVKKADLPDDFILDTQDYFVHGNLRYGKLEIDDLISVYVISGEGVTGSLPYKVVPTLATDNIGINDGIA